MMMKGILTFTIFIVAVAAVVPVLSKGKRAAANISPGAGREINMPAALKKRPEIFAFKAGSGELFRVGNNGYLNSKSGLNDLHLFAVNLRQNVSGPFAMKTVPAIGMEDSAFRDQNILSARGTEISFRKVGAFIKNSD